MSTPFDRSLEGRELMAAADAYASQHGEPGTSAYRAAWLRFRKRVRTTEELGQWRSACDAEAGEVVAVLDAAIERAIAIAGASMATAQLLDARIGGLRLVAHSGFPSRFLEFFEIVDGTATSCGSALASRRPVWVPDTSRSAIFAGTLGLEVMLDAGSRAVASLPVISPSGRPIAVISPHHARPTSWTPDCKRALQRLARATGRVLHELLPTE